MKYHVYIYDRFCSGLSVYQSLQGLEIQFKNWFLTKQIAAWKCTTFYV